MSRLTPDGTAEPVSRDQILRHERGQGNMYFPCSADHVQDWQPCPVDPYSCYMCDHTYMLVVFSFFFIHLFIFTGPFTITTHVYENWFVDKHLQRFGFHWIICNSLIFSESPNYNSNSRRIDRASKAREASRTLNKQPAGTSWVR